MNKNLCWNGRWAGVAAAQIRCKKSRIAQGRIAGSVDEGAGMAELGVARGRKRPEEAVRLRVGDNTPYAVSGTSAHPSRDG